MLSFYYWRYKTEPRPALGDILDSATLLPLKKKGFYLYTIDGRVAVERVCRYERLDEELDAIRTQLALPERLELPRAKASYRKDRRHYGEIFTAAEQAKVAELFADEIRLFGYQF